MVTLQLMKLQSRYGNDERFKLDAKFAESDSEQGNLCQNIVYLGKAKYCIFLEGKILYILGRQNILYLGKAKYLYPRHTKY